MLVNGINNSGITDFNLLGADEDLKQYRAKLVKTGQSFTDGNEVYEMQGWAWNDNLGWVSFYCDGNDGTNGQPVKDGTNLGASCGQQTYGVRLKYNELEGSLSFVGYAWNDATGYISMNSLNGGTVKYGLKVGVKTEAHPDEGAIIGDHQDLGGSATPYAWSQSLTWINFTGVRAEVELQIILGCEDENYIGVCPCVIIPGVEDCKDDPGDPGVDDLDVYAQTDPDLEAFPIADGVDYYAIRLSFKDLEGNEITKDDLLDDYNIRIFFQWGDTVKRNQVSGDKVNSSLMWLKTPFTSGAGAITFKPVFLTNEGTTDEGKSTKEFTDEGAPTGTMSSTGVSTLSGTPVAADIATGSTSSSNMAWVGNDLIVYVKSLAPTTGGNKSKVVSLDGDIYRLNDTGGTSGEKNNLILKSINWAMQKKSPSDSPVITGGTVYDKAGETDGTYLDFRPALEVETLNTVSDLREYKDTLVLYRNVATKLEVETKEEGSTSFVKPSNLDTTVTMNLIKDENLVFNISAQDEEGSIIQIPYRETYDYLPNRIRFTPYLEQEKTMDYTSGIGLESQISYVVGPPYFDTVSYYSNHLPRTDHSIANPVAVIQGTLYGTGTTTQTGININGVGDNNTNIVKDTVYENVKKLVRDQKITENNATISGNFNCNGCTKIQDGTATDEEILYVKGDATISGNVTWTGYKVLIVDGGNLYIDGNLYNSGDTKATQNKLGLVVIRNTGEDLKDAGNIYVAPEVTNIQAFAVVWGAVFSYDGESKTSITGHGEFNWADEATMVSALNKQLIWQGGISSNNTIGGVDEDESGKYYKTGYQILPQNDENLFTARLYDLNYFRYFRKTLHYDENGIPIAEDGTPICEQSEDATSIYDCDSISLEDMYADADKYAEGADHETETNPLYIKYVPPYSKSVIFSKEKSLTF